MGSSFNKIILLISLYSLTGCGGLFAGILEGDGVTYSALEQQEFGDGQDSIDQAPMTPADPVDQGGGNSILDDFGVVLIDPALQGDPSDSGEGRNRNNQNDNGQGNANNGDPSDGGDGRNMDYDWDQVWREYLVDRHEGGKGDQGRGYVCNDSGERNGGACPNCGNQGGMGTPARIGIETNVQKKCQVGEIDMIKMVMACLPDLRLIATIKDGSGERVINDYGTMNDYADPRALGNAINDMSARFDVTGSMLDLFLCIDHDGDGRCVDEEINDLNAFNEVMTLAFRMAGDQLNTKTQFQASGNHGDDDDDGDDDGDDDDGGGKDLERRDVACEDCGSTNLMQSLCANPVISRFAAVGGVFYHQHVNASGRIMASSSQGYDNIERIVLNIVKNIKDPNEDGNAEDFRVERFNDDDDDDDDDGAEGFGLFLSMANPNKCEHIGARADGCFAKGTEIALSKDLKMPIEKFKVGDKVYLSNGEKAKIKKIVSGPEEKPMIRFQLVDNKTVLVTDKHPMFTEIGIVQAKDVHIGARFLTAEGKWRQIKTIETVQYKDHVYNIELEGNSEKHHLLYANGIVSGDLYLQNQITQKALKAEMLSKSK